MKDKFKKFLINENKVYLGKQVSDVLNDLQGLADDAENLGSRHLSRLVDNVVDDLRKILHSQWGPSEQKYLEDLQQVAVALKVAIEESGDLRELIPAAINQLETLSGRLGAKVNDLEAPDMPGAEDVDQNDFELTGEGPESEDPGQMDQGVGEDGDVGADPVLPGGMGGEAGAPPGGFTGVPGTDSPV